MDAVNEPFTWGDYLALELGAPLLGLALAVLVHVLAPLWVLSAESIRGRSRRRFEKLMAELEDDE